eukprot:TRINITY_DN12618_c0_g2_i3.p1 TRINITY_DN12618_c0_g2~~TRINITY_DN12618_c0_g2_i3.p1  ORF type:complete len:513 (-),score=46.64 TRINITY_DN12618_c0_g2_i3:209-1747(-)
MRKSDEMTPLDELVKRKLEHRRAEIARFTFVSIANLMTLGIFRLLFTVLSGIPLHSEVQAICGVCALALSICAYSAPPSTPKLPEMYYACMMIIFTAYFLWSPPDLFMISQRTSFFVRFVLSVAVLNIPHMVLWNLAVLGANIIYTTTDTNLFSSYVWTLSFDLVATLSFIVISIVFERWMSSETHRETQISRLKISNSSSMLLLDMMCDVFLELSDKLMIACESPSFAALMFKSAGSSVQGQSFTSFLEDDLGRQTFERQLIAGTRQNGNVGVCNATLKDGLHNKIHVEVFFVKVELDTDIYHYLVGIRESNQEACGTALSFPEPEFRTHTPSEARGTISNRSESSQTFRKQTPSEHKGTLPISSRSELSQAPVRYRRKVKGGLQHPQLKKTERNARCKSMETCLASWNIHVPGGACCCYHAYVIAAKQTLSRHLSKGPCRKNFARLIADGLQCQTCGFIIDDGQEDEYDACPACDSIELKPFGGDEIDNCESGSSVLDNEDCRSDHFLHL